MDIKKIIQEEIKKTLIESALDFDAGTEGESLKIMKSPKGFVLGMAAMGSGGKEYARSIESPYFRTKDEVCAFFSKWDPSSATMQESIMAEQNNSFVILGGPEQVCSVNKGMMEDNYPAGAKDDPSAPYNQDDNVRKGEKADEINFEVVWYADNAGFAIVKDKKGRLYAFNTEMVDKDDYEPYADREEEFEGFDEDGMPDVSYGDWDLDANVIENYINDNMGEIKVGKGLEAFESGDYHAVEIDDEIKVELEKIAKYIKNPQDRQKLLDIIGRINEVAQKITDTDDTMDTPTGTLFTISGE